MKGKDRSGRQKDSCKIQNGGQDHTVVKGAAVAVGWFVVSHLHFYAL